MRSSLGRLCRHIAPALAGLGIVLGCGGLVEAQISEAAGGPQRATELRAVESDAAAEFTGGDAGEFGASAAGGFVNTGADNCNNVTIISIPIGLPGSPAVTTISGDNTTATGIDCTNGGNQTSWWEAFTLDSCATVTVSFCGTIPAPPGPLNPRVFTLCPAAGTNCGTPITRNAEGQGAPTCGDANRWMRFTNLAAGTYYLPVNANAGVTRGPYELQIRAESCVGACCNLDDATCAESVTSAACAGPNQAFSAGVTCCRAECRPPGEEYARSGVELLSQVPVSAFPGFSGEGNDVWGYVSPGSREYALVGLDSSTGFVDITDPFNPVVVADIPDTPSFWSDMKVYQQYGYNVNENGGGMQIFDLSQIDDGVVTLVGAYTANLLQTVHTLTLNPDSGYAYLNGSNLNGGDLVILSLGNPAAPTLAASGVSAGFYVHDSQVVSYTSGPYAGREIAFCYCISNDRIRIVDVTNKTSRFVRSTIMYPTMTGPHQGWLTSDRKHIIVDDEFDENAGLVSSATTYIFNVENLDAPFFVDAYTNGKCTIDHDLITDGNLVYKANYYAGLRVDDISDINNAHEVAFFDTHPESNNFGFNGAWGSFAGFPSGVVLASNMNERGLFVLSYDCNRNMIDDTDDIANLTSNDCNGNGLPDECEVNKARAAKPETIPVEKSRYLSFIPGNAGAPVAIRVKLVNLDGFPSFNGAVRWVGQPQGYADPTGGTFTAAALQCTPTYINWAGVSPLHVYGIEVVPGSTYEVQMLLNFCDLTTDESKYSTPLTVTTGKWADIVAPFGALQPDFGDISALVDAFMAVPTGPKKPIAQLQPDAPNPANNVNFLDISACVSAFQGASYSFSGPLACP